jgi:hypothetical protein
MNWIYYLLEANGYLSVFYLLYYAAFRNETWYQLNRAYLLMAGVIAFILPVTQLGILKPDDTGSQVITIISAQAIKHTAIAPAPTLNLADYLLGVYLLGAAVMALLFVYKLVSLIRLIRKPKRSNVGEYKLFVINGSSSAFSFFNYLFIGENVSGRDTIIRHELVHIRERHSFDIVFLELIKIISWFNPLIYVMQADLKAVHEYIADEQTAAFERDASGYSSFLVNNAYGIGGPTIAHSFFNFNLLKKRIIMLHQKRSGNLARLKYLMALPVGLALLCLSTLGFTKTYGWLDLAPAKKQPSQKTLRDTNKSLPAGKYRYAASNTTGKGYKYEETGYLVKNEANFRVIITEKNGEQTEYYRNSATKAQLALLQNKYGYSFPKMKIFSRLPPPPPLPPAPVALNPPSPQSPPSKLEPPKSITINTPVKKMAPPPPPQPKVPEITIAPPPPPKPFSGLYKYLAVHIRYPTKARDNHIGGREMVMFDVTDGKIGNINIIRNIDADIDGEITRVLNNVSGQLDMKSGHYGLPLSFVVQDANGNNFQNSPGGKITYGTITGTQLTMLDEVVIMSYMK